MSATDQDPSRPLQPHREPAEFDALLQEAGWVRTLARQLARDQAAADDVAQGTLALALERRPGTRGSLRPWLARVVVRLTRRQRRGDARRQFREGRAAVARSATSPGSDELLVRLEEQQRLADEVRRLPEPYRGVLLRRYYEGLSPAEIARSTGASPATVRSQLARGLERLREQYGRNRESHSVLPYFLLAAGFERSLLPRLGAEVLAMKSSLKLAAGTVLASVALVGTGVLTGLFDADSEAAGGAITQSPPSLDEREQPQGVVADADAEQQRLEAGVDEEAPASEMATTAAPASEPLLTILFGRIVDDAGVPLAGARLASIFSDGRPRGTGNLAETDREGRFELALTDAHVRHWETEVYPMVFSASMEGHATHFMISTPRWHDETDLGDLVLVPGGALTGIVVDAWGQAIPNAVLYATEPVITADFETLRVSGPDTTIVRPRGDADENGRFQLSGVTPGKARLWVHAKEHLWTITEPVEVVAGAVRDCGALVLEEVSAEQRVTGLVLRPDGNPAAEAEIAFESNRTMQEGTLSADSQGQFRLVPKGEGPLRIIARDPAGRYGSSAVITVRSGMEVELQLTERRIIALLITEPDGTPIEDAAVMPFLPSESQMRGGLAVLPGQDWIRTDSEGHAIVPVPAETFLVSGSKRGYEGQRLGPFEPRNAPAELTLELVPEPRIEGRIMAYGQPVAGMHISLAKRISGFVPREMGFPIRFFTNRQADVDSDADGFFSCSVNKEWAEITVLATGDEYATGETDLTIQAGKGANGVVVEVTSGGTLTGKLLPPPGQSAHGYVVAASRGDGFPVWTRTDEEGRYRLEQLTPGAWRVEGRDREPAREILSVAQRPEDKEFNWNVDVVDGQVVEFDVDMRGLGDIELSGHFLIDGVPAAGWTAELVPPRDTMQREPIPAAELDSAGNFTLTARAGRYDLRLVGTLDGDVRIEALREIHLEGTRQEWDGQLTTGTLSETVEGDHDKVRLVRGHYYEGDREFTLVPLIDGRCEGRVPIGSSSFQVVREMTEWGPAWIRIRTVEIQ